MQVNKLHKKSSALVKAAAQAEFLMAIEGDLTEEEHAQGPQVRNCSGGSGIINDKIHQKRGFSYAGIKQAVMSPPQRIYFSRRRSTLRRDFSMTGLLSEEKVPAE